MIEANALQAVAEDLMAKAAIEIPDDYLSGIKAMAEAEEGGAALRLRALVCMPDGSKAHRAERRGPPAHAARLGRDAGEELRGAAGPAFFAALAHS